MPVRRQHHAADLINVLVRHAFVEEVAHRIDENLLWLRPADGVAELLRYQAEVETEFKWMAGHAAEAFRERLSVAMETTGTDFAATAHWVPCCIRPLNL